MEQNKNPMDQWDDYFPPLNLWNYNLHFQWFPYYDKEVDIDEIVRDFKELRMNERLPKA